MAELNITIRKCAVCGEEVGGRYKYCPACGSPMAEPSLRQPPLPAADGEGEGKSTLRPEIPRRRAAAENVPPRPVRIRTNADSAEIRFREFSAVARKRRRHDDRKSVLPLVFALMIFLASIGGGVYWFFRQAEELPWDSVVVERPVVREQKESPDEDNVKKEILLVDPGEAGKPRPPEERKEKDGAAGEITVQAPPGAVKPSEAIPAVSGPSRGIVTGSGVNLRGSATIESPVVGKVSSGKKVEVLESRIPDDSAEAVTLADVELTAPDGKKIKVARGRGVTVTGRPDASGLVTVTLPGDKGKVVYKVSQKSLSDPQAWPWYRIKPQGGGEGWIFGKFLTILDSRDEGLSPAFLQSTLASFGTTRDEIQNKLGKPAKTASRKVKTAAGEGTEITMTFKGVSVVLFEGPGGSEVRKITLSSAGHSLHGELQAGADKRRVLAVLGHPNDLAGGAEIYRAGKSSGIKIVYENYKIKTITAGPLD